MFERKLCLNFFKGREIVGHIETRTKVIYLMYNERDDLFNIDLCNDILIKYFFSMIMVFM